MKKENAELYGHEIEYGKTGRTLIQQIYEVLRDEIRNGRWQVGDRLPSSDMLSEETGLTRTPIARAFRRLKEEGYLHSVRRKGSFVKSSSPRNRKEFEPIGIAVHLFKGPTEGTTEPSESFWLSKIIEFADNHDYNIKVKYIREQQWDTVDEPEGPFGRDVKGIIALHPFERNCFLDMKERKIPVVHMGNEVDSLPSVRGDTRAGIYLLTQRVITEGHRNIICYVTPSHGQREAEIRYMGYENAMKQAGLTPNRESFEDSYSYPYKDLTSIGNYLVQYSDATAIVVMEGPDMAQTIISVARTKGIRVPEDISFVCHGVLPSIEFEPGRRLTCVQHNTEKEIENCFNLLFEQIKTKQFFLSRILIRPHVVEGQSLMPPRH